jgi:hypothetical protein
MEDTKKVVLDRAVKLLNALKLPYVIVLDDGEKISQGGLDVVEKKIRTRRPSTAPLGTYTNFLRDKGMQEMEIGDVLVLECGDISAESVRSTSGSLSNKWWGSGTIVTTIKDNTLEMMRVG